MLGRTLCASLALLQLLAVLFGGILGAEATPMTSSLPNHEPISPNKRILVLLDDAARKNSSSKFFETLAQNGYKLKYKKIVEGSTVVLKTNGEYDYDHVIVISSESVSASERTVYNFLEFIDNGGNVLVGTSTAPKWLRDIGVENGVKFDDSPVLDRFPPSEGETLVVRWPEHAKRFVGNAPSAEASVRYSGISLDLTPDASQFGGVVVLKAPLTAYSPKRPVSGTKLGLIASVQMRNNARVTFCGSALLFDNANAASNTAFLLRLAKWTFAEASVLRVKSWTHFKQDGSGPERQVKSTLHLANNLPKSHFPSPEWGPDARLYRVKDNVEYHLSLEILDHDGKVKPYDANDVQVEFVMLDPYQRRTFESDGKGNFVAKFQLPDQYGTFQFRVVYNRPGLSRLRLIDVVNVRPFRHDEYERFIPSAFPYYTAVGVVMVGFLIFSVSFVVIQGRHIKTE